MIIVSCQSRNQFLWFCDWKKLTPDIEAHAVINGFVGRSSYKQAEREEDFVLLPGGKDNQSIRKLVMANVS